MTSIDQRDPAVVGANLRLRLRKEFLRDCAKAFVRRNGHFGEVVMVGKDVTNVSEGDLRKMKAAALVADWEALFDEIETRRPEPTKESTK